MGYVNNKGFTPRFYFFIFFIGTRVISSQLFRIQTMRMRQARKNVTYSRMFGLLNCLQRLQGHWHKCATVWLVRLQPGTREPHHGRNLATLQTDAWSRTNFPSAGWNRCPGMVKYIEIRKPMPWSRNRSCIIPFWRQPKISPESVREAQLDASPDLGRNSESLFVVFIVSCASPRAARICETLFFCNQLRKSIVDFQIFKQILGSTKKNIVILVKIWENIENENRKATWCWSGASYSQTLLVQLRSSRTTLQICTFEKATVFLFEWADSELFNRKSPRVWRKKHRRDIFTSGKQLCNSDSSWSTYDDWLGP